MGQGDYTHASYLTRQRLGLGASTAGANGTSAFKIAGVSNMRIRNGVGAVTVAGTIGTNVLSIIQANGTGILIYTSTGISTNTGVTALGTISYGTGGNTVFNTGTSGDMNAMIPSGSILSIKNGADATGVTDVTLEGYLDPATTWTGQN